MWEERYGHLPLSTLTAPLLMAGGKEITVHEQPSAVRPRSPLIDLMVDVHRSYHQKTRLFKLDLIFFWYYNNHELIIFSFYCFY